MFIFQIIRVSRITTANLKTTTSNLKKFVIYEYGIIEKLIEICYIWMFYNIYLVVYIIEPKFT